MMDIKIITLIDGKLFTRCPFCTSKISYLSCINNEFSFKCEDCRRTGKVSDFSVEIEICPWCGKQ